MFSFLLRQPWSLADFIARYIKKTGIIRTAGLPQVPIIYWSGNDFLTMAMANEPSDDPAEPSGRLAKASPTVPEVKNGTAKTSANRSEVKKATAEV